MFLVKTKRNRDAEPTAALCVWNPTHRHPLKASFHPGNSLILKVPEDPSFSYQWHTVTKLIDSTLQFSPVESVTSTGSELIFSALNVSAGTYECQRSKEATKTQNFRFEIG